MDFFYVNKIDDDFIKSDPMRCSNFIDADSQLYNRTVQPFRIYIISLNYVPSASLRGILVP